MAQTRKLSQGQVTLVLTISAERRRLLAELAKLPTLEKLATQLGVSVSALKQLTTGRTYRS